MLLFTVQCDIPETSSNKLRIVVIVVLSILLFISLTFNIIVLMYNIICRANEHKQDSVAQDMILQGNVSYVTYGVAMQGNVAYGVAKQENAEYDVDVQENLAYGMPKQENAEYNDVDVQENVAYNTSMQENVTYDVAMQDNVAYDVHI